MVATHAAGVFVPAVPLWLDIVVTILAFAAALTFTAWYPEHARKKGARKLQEQVLEASVRLLGQEHPDTQMAMLSLAEMLYAEGDLAGARKLQEQVLEASVRLLGQEHPDTLKAMNSLALTLYAQGDLAGACQLQALSSGPAD
jgi:hypothetical protein